jgi:hypothetical protein
LFFAVRRVDPGAFDLCVHVASSEGVSVGFIDRLDA